jgi:hypothetical protein
MYPFSGVTTIISFIIIFFGFLIKKIKFLFNIKSKDKDVEISSVSVLAVFIIFIIFMIVASISSYMMFYALKKENNVKIVQEVVHKCKPFTTVNSDKKIILRLDDVQSYAWSDVSIKIIEDAFYYQFPVVIGVIPYQIEEDAVLKRFIRKNECNVEIAIHGYDHGYSDGFSEFEQIDYELSINKLKLAENAIEKTLNKKSSIFIPPNNVLSVDAQKALLDRQFVISSEGKNFFDYHTSTWDYVNNTMKSNDAVISDCEKLFQSGKDLCIVMLHPQDFSDENKSIDISKYQNYIELLSLINLNDYSVYTYNQYITEKEILFFNSNKELRIGDTDYDVILLQKYLNKLGFIVTDSGPGSVNFESDYFGARTENAVSKFQAEYKINTTNGYFDLETKNKLKELISI